jgi:hypothetical protein
MEAGGQGSEKEAILQINKACPALLSFIIKIIIRRNKGYE